MAENEKYYKNFKIAVPAAYQDVFSHFYFAENTTGETITKTLLPSYQTILIFNFGTPAILYTIQKTELKVDKCIVLGPIKQAFSYSLPANSTILVANFKDDSFYNFFGSAAVAEHLPINPDDLLVENCFTSLWKQLNNISDNNDRVEYILEFSRPYLKQRNVIAEQLANFKNTNLSPIKSIANVQKQTERNIQLNHKKHLGYTAKEISRYQRFLKAVELIQGIASSSNKMDWFDIVNECGFYDQSQLIHDFKHYINLSPTKYLKFQQDICIPNAE